MSANLLARMRCVMRHGNRWAARAEGREHYAYGNTPEEAIEAALRQPEPEPARRDLFEVVTTIVTRRPLL